MHTSEPPVDPGNARQASDWDGDTGALWASRAATFERTTAAYNAHLLAAAELTPTSAVLDVGCGSGDTTRAAARVADDGLVLGLDLSERLLAVAREATARAGLVHVRYERADAQVHPLAEGGYDVVLSRFGAMFFADPVAAFTNLRRTLRPQGRLVMVVWQALATNELMSSVLSAALGAPPPPPPDGPGPFSLADPHRVRSLLGAAGFTPGELTEVREPMWIGDDEAEALDFVRALAAGPLARPDADAAQVLERLAASVAEHAGPDGVRYDSAAWLVQARPNS